jgi:hypothetical protein
MNDVRFLALMDSEAEDLLLVLRTEDEDEEILRLAPVIRRLERMVDGTHRG